MIRKDYEKIRKIQHKVGEDRQLGLDQLKSVRSAPSALGRYMTVLRHYILAKSSDEAFLRIYRAAGKKSLVQYFPYPGQIVRNSFIAPAVLRNYWSRLI